MFTKHKKNYDFTLPPVRSAEHKTDARLHRSRKMKKNIVPLAQKHVIAWIDPR